MRGRGRRFREPHSRGYYGRKRPQSLDCVRQSAQGRRAQCRANRRINGQGLPEMIKIGLLGYGGRMGQLIVAEIAANGACTLAGGVDRALKPEFKKAEGVLITTHADEVIAISDVVIDFTS